MTSFLISLYCKYPMRKTQQKPKDEQTVDILKRVAKRVEEATIDISSIKTDIKFVKLRLSGVEHNTELMKVDIENMKVDTGELGNKIDGVENRLNKRIEHVADLITIELGGKLQNHEKRIRRLEHFQQTA